MVLSIESREGNPRPFQLRMSNPSLGRELPFGGCRSTLAPRLPGVVLHEDEGKKGWGGGRKEGVDFAHVRYFGRHHER